MVVVRRFLSILLIRLLKRALLNTILMKVLQFAKVLNINPLEEQLPGMSPNDQLPGIAPPTKSNKL